MKCPNCSKEAIFVNGKYVCLDCGIEITPEQQAVQNMGDQQVFPSAVPAAPITDDTATVDQPTQDQIVVPIPVEAESAPAESEPTIEATTTSEKPVQQYYEEALSQGENPSNTNGGGVYDFSAPSDTAADTFEAQAENSSSEPTIANLSTPVEEPTATIIPEPVADPEIAVAPQPEMQSGPEVAPISQPEPVVSNPDSYFTPNSFDIKTEPVSEVEPPTEIPVATPTEPAVSVPEVETIGMPKPQPATEEPQSVSVTTPEEAYSQAPLENTPPTLDEMLGSTTTAAPQTESPVSAYGPTPIVGSEPTPLNVNEESKMPSVESVFGAQPEEKKATDVHLPTAQDFGVAPKPQPQKNNKWILPVVIGAVSLLLLSGGALALISISNKNSQIKYPVVLDQEGINALSANVSGAMQADQGTAADFILEADFSEISVNDNLTDKETIATQLREKYKLSGNWYSDPEGDVSTDTNLGESSDKRTYIKKDSQTFVYSAATQKYEQQAGLVLPYIPAIFEAEEKAALLYTTNVESATLLGPEQIDGIEYSKYEIVPNGEILKETLEVIGGVFKDAQYESFNTDNLKIMLWLGTDNKIKKISFDGSITLESEKITGTLTLSGEAVYQYLDVKIESPASAPPTTENTGTPVSATQVNEEEGQTSSIDNQENDLVEAKG